MLIASLPLSEHCSPDLHILPNGETLKRSESWDAFFSERFVGMPEDQTEQRLEMMLAKISKCQSCLASTVNEVQRDVKSIVSLLSSNTRDMRDFLRENGQDVQASGRRSFLESKGSRTRFSPYSVEDDVPSVVLPGDESTAPGPSSSRSGSAPPSTWPMSIVQREETKPSQLETNHLGSVSITTATSDKWRTHTEAVTKSSLIMKPGSTKRLLFDFISLITLIYDLTTIPYALAWDLQFDGYIMWSGLFTSTFWTGDMAMNFFTAFQKDGILEARPRQVALHYFQGSFFLDLVILVCDWVNIFIAFVAHGTAHPLRVLRFARMSRLLRLAGLLRLIRVLRIVDDFIERSVSEGYRMLLSVVGLFFSVLWINHVLCCVWFWIGKHAHSDTDGRWISSVVAGSQISYEGVDEVFQYLSAFHWSMAQLTGGSNEINATNTSERIFSICLLFCGLLFSSTLVSSLSATMIDFQMQMNDTHQKIRTLRNFLRQNSVESGLSHRVVQEAEKRVAGRDGLISYEDVSLLELLPNSMRTELRCQIFKRHMCCIPIFRLWTNLSPPAMQQMCSDECNSVCFVYLQPWDTLFNAGDFAGNAYFLVSGTLFYHQEPMSSPVVSDLTALVTEGTVLCESALWSHWIHVGTAECDRQCQVMRISAKGVADVLQRQVAIQQITKDYATQYHGRVTTAVPPTSDYPSDLSVPFTDFGEIVASLENSLQVIIARDALQAAANKPMVQEDLVKFTLKGLNGLNVMKRTKEVRPDILLNEVVNGKATIVLNGAGEITRVVSLVAFDICRAEDEILAQLGELKKADSQESVIVAGCRRPGGRLQRGELPLAAANRLLSSQLRPLQKATIDRLEREVQWQDCVGFPMKKQYLRTVAYITMQEEVVAPIIRQLSHSVTATPCRKKLNDVYVFQSGEKAFLFSWISRVEFDYFQTAEGDLHLSTLLACLDSDGPSLCLHTPP